jgi:hypothetical protein
MPVTKLNLPNQDEFLEYYLFALHTPLIDYKLAYMLNKNLNINLNRISSDLDIVGQSGLYSVFQYEDHDNFLNWSLISNYSFLSELSPSNNGLLFQDNEVELKKSKLLNEFDNIDYFLKIENNIDSIKIKKIIQLIYKIPNIISAYSLNVKKVKNKENLNFYND